MRDNAEIKMIVEGAFHPLRCVAEIHDYDMKLRFRVFDVDNPLLVFPEEVLAGLRDDTALEALIRSARDCLERRGYSLEPWSLR